MMQAMLLVWRLESQNCEYEPSQASISLKFRTLGILSSRKASVFYVFERRRTWPEAVDGPVVRRAGGRVGIPQLDRNDLTLRLGAAGVLDVVARAGDRRV
jgi:hypothetical protein